MSYPQPTEPNKKRRRVSPMGSAAARMVLLDLRQCVIHRRDQGLGGLGRAADCIHAGGLRRNDGLGDLLKGGTIKCHMSRTPNLQRGIQPSDFPYSFSTEEKKK